MSKLYNLARMTTATTGTGTITLGVAVSGYLTFANAGVQSGDVLFYGINDGAASEVGWGTYTASGTTLSRNVIKSTNSNAAINLDGSAQVYVTALAADGGDLMPGFDHPMRGFDTAINLQLNASVASNILTVAIKGNNGSDPGNSSPVLVAFRDATAGNGDPAWVAITSALSISTNAVGASLGTANGVPFRIWVVLFNNGGTPVLGLWQSVTGGASPTAIAPLNEASPASSTAFSSSATSAGTFYTPNGATVTSKSFRILGYVDYASGLTTAGTYASAPTTIQLFGPGVKLPGEEMQWSQMLTTAGVSVSSTTFTATNVTLSMSPSSAPNLVEFSWSGTVVNNSGASAVFQMFRGSTAIGPFVLPVGSAASRSLAWASAWRDAPGTTSSTTYTLKMAGNGTAATFPSNETEDSGTVTAQMYLREIMV
jgi:hypothetical protein